MYSDYLGTKYWKNKREEILEKSNGRCKFCKKNSSLNIHHKTYKDFPYHEENKDLITLCKRCHWLWHELQGDLYITDDILWRIRTLKKSKCPIDLCIKFSSTKELFDIVNNYITKAKQFRKIGFFKEEEQLSTI